MNMHDCPRVFKLHIFISILYQFVKHEQIVLTNQLYMPSNGIFSEILPKE